MGLCTSKRRHREQLEEDRERLKQLLLKTPRGGSDETQIRQRLHSICIDIDLWDDQRNKRSNSTFK